MRGVWKWGWVRDGGGCEVRVGARWIWDGTKESDRKVIGIKTIHLVTMKKKQRKKNGKEKKRAISTKDRKRKRKIRK